MLHVAIIGSGPAGYYTAEALQKQFGDEVRIDVIDRLPTPFGLIRAGVAPDHQSIKAVSRRYETTALTDNVRFIGNIDIGSSVTVAELLDLYHAVVVATGAPGDRKLGIPGEELPGVIGSATLVGWYNGHPAFAHLDPPLLTDSVAVIGAGNVALDVTRVLAKTRDEFEGSDIARHALAALSLSGVKHIHIFSRRGPHQIQMTPKELGELGELQRAVPHVRSEDLPPEEADAGLEPGVRKSVTHLRQFARTNGRDAEIDIRFDFYMRPVRIEGEGRVERLIVERTRLDETGNAVGTGEEIVIPCGMVVSCIGYRTHPIPGIPYDDRLGRFTNEEGRIAPGLYCVGWARRGPTGTIGTNRPDGFAIAELIAADAPSGTREGRPGLDRLIATRGLKVVTFQDWKKIDAAEIARARDGSPREKFTSIDEMLSAIDP